MKLILVVQNVTDSSHNGPGLGDQELQHCRFVHHQSHLPHRPEIGRIPQSSDRFLARTELETGQHTVTRQQKKLGGIIVLNGSDEDWFVRKYGSSRWIH
jgi:hypothetical protein